MPISHEEFSEMMNRNPSLRISRSNSPQKHPKPIPFPARSERPERSAGLNATPQKRKYRNEPVVQDGERFDSKKEAARYAELQVLERAGAISGLRLKPKYEFVHNGVRIGAFTPDYEYVEDGQLIVEDTKSPSTRRETSYRLRKKMLKAFFGLDVRET